MSKDKDKIRAWNKAAIKNPMRYIAAQKRNWEQESFFASGRRVVGTEIVPFLKQESFELTNKRALDIGCGIGRITRPLSDFFNEVYGIDFSEQMIKKAKELNADKKNLHFQSNDGENIPFKDNYFDFCFSYLTFRHIKNKQIIGRYIKEICRILKPKGLFKIEVNGQKYGKTIPVPRFIHNILLKINILKYYYAIKRKDAIASIAVPGVWLLVNDVKKYINSTSLKIIKIEGENTPSMWISGIKPDIFNLRNGLS